MKSPADKIPAHQITPESAYLNRRTVMQAGLVAVSAVATGFVYRKLNHPGAGRINTARIENLVSDPVSDPKASGFRVDEPMTSLENITHYNNFYEFSTDKEGVAEAAAKFVSRPWQVAVEGLVSNSKVFDLDDLKKISPPQERVYRMRCVEGWSMVIPWAGIPLADVLAHVQPLSGAKYVAFQTLMDPKRLPGEATDVLDWPYVEGLRMDEAMHPLALLAVGLYGRELPSQNGAPLRLVVPWKYGFKGIKSIAKITLLDSMPTTTWNRSAPNEYGFYANVNPRVDHPRWSQATEQRIGVSGRRDTLLFNGYGDQVASLYTGMDLRKNF